MDSSQLKLNYHTHLMDVTGRFEQLRERYKHIKFHDSTDEEIQEDISNCDHDLKLIGFTNPHTGNNEYYHVVEVSSHGILSVDENDSTKLTLFGFSDIDSVVGKMELITLMEEWSEKK